MPSRGSQNAPKDAERKEDYVMRTCQEYLVFTFQYGQGFGELLLSQGVLTEDDVAQIEQKKTWLDKNRNAMELLRKAGPRAYRALKQWLGTNQRYILIKLLGTELTWDALKVLNRDFEPGPDNNWVRRADLYRELKRQGLDVPPGVLDDCIQQIFPGALVSYDRIYGARRRLQYRRINWKSTEHHDKCTRSYTFPMSNDQLVTKPAVSETSKSMTDDQLAIKPLSPTINPQKDGETSIQEIKSSEDIKQVPRAKIHTGDSATVKRAPETIPAVNGPLLGNNGRRRPSDIILRIRPHSVVFNHGLGRQVGERSAIMWFIQAIHQNQYGVLGRLGNALNQHYGCVLSRVSADHKTISLHLVHFSPREFDSVLAKMTQHHRRGYLHHIVHDSLFSNRAVVSDLLRRRVTRLTLEIGVWADYSIAW